MIIRMQTETRNRMGDYALSGERVIVRTAEKILFWVRVFYQFRAAPCEFRAEI